MTFRMPGFSPRIDLEITRNWKDEEIARLICDYYGIFDRTKRLRGGLQQTLGGMTKLKNILGDRKFENFVEIGVSDGGSLWMYSQMFCTPSSRITGLDIAPILSTFLITNELKLYRGRSVEYLIVDCNQFVNEFADESIDLLHIDANHDYESVKEYFDNYYPKVAKNGIILIHDTAACEGSIKFRKEILEPNYDHQLIIGDWLITGEYDVNPNIPSPGISLIRKH